MNGISALIKETPQRAPMAELCSAMWGHSEKMAIYEPEGMLSAGALILDFLASRTIKNKCFLSHSAYGICYSITNGLRQVGSDS